MLTETAEGLYCAAGDFHIDPWGAVAARADHARARRPRARRAARAYLCADAVRRRCSPAASAPACDDRDAAVRRGRRRSAASRVSFHPAGHVLGSAQIRIEGPDGVWVVVGRLQARAGSDLRAVRAGALRHVHHRIDLRPADLSLGPDRERHRRHRRLVGRNGERGRTSVLFCYTLGKAQRLLAELARVTDRPVLRPRHDAADDRGLSRRRRRDAAARRVVDRAAARHVVRRRAGAGAAVGARHAVDAAARRPLRRVRLRPDARARRPPAARLRPRLRPLRPRRLAGAARRRSPRPAPAASSPRTATPSRSRAILREQGLDAGVIRTAWEGERRSRRIRMKRFAGLFAAHRPTRPRPTPRSRRWRATSASAPPADAAWAVFFLTGRRLKRLRALGGDPRLDAGRDRPRRMAARRVLRGRRRRRRNGGAGPRSAAARRLREDRRR